MTSTTMTFDTLAYAKRLKQVGFTEEQAEVQAETLARFYQEKFCLKYGQEKKDKSLMFKLSGLMVITIVLCAGFRGILLTLSP